MLAIDDDSVEGHTVVEVLAALVQVDVAVGVSAVVRDEEVVASAEVFLQRPNVPAGYPVQDVLGGVLWAR